MHISNKYNPYKRSRKKWECWKLTDGEYENVVNRNISRYRNYFGIEYDKDHPEVKVSRYRTNSFYFGAYQKPNGAWGSNNSANYLKFAKKNSTHIYRRKEKQALDNYMKKGSFEDGIENIVHGEGYWD